jgi:hypothetical protein
MVHDVCEYGVEPLTGHNKILVLNIITRWHVWLTGRFKGVFQDWSQEWPPLYQNQVEDE